MSERNRELQEVGFQTLKQNEKKQTNRTSEEAILTDKGGNHMRFATIQSERNRKSRYVLKNGVLPIEALNAAKGTAWY